MFLNVTVSKNAGFPPLTLSDGITEIMAKAEDAAKINRIYDKLGMAEYQAIEVFVRMK